MDGVEFGDFLDLLYAAPVEPTLWVSAMERLADLVGGSSASLTRLSVADGSGSGIIARIDPVMPRRYVDHFARRNPFVIKRDPRSYIRAWRPAIRFHGDFLPRDEVVRTEFYNDFLKPQAIGASMMIGLSANGFETSVLNINTPGEGFAAPHVEIARRLHPHLCRAFDLSRRLAEATAGIDDPHEVDGDDAVFIVDAAARVHRANPRARRLAAPGGGLRLVRGCLTATDRTTADRLARLIGAAAARTANADDPADRGGTVRVPEPNGAPLTATVVPLTPGIASIFADAPLALVCVDCPAVPDRVADRIRLRFGLTPAETRLGVALLDGGSPRQIAAAFGVSVQTVRNQLQSLYGKTETNRQSALVLLLAEAGRAPD